VTSTICTPADPVTIAAEPMLVPAREAARLCGRSLASWWRDVASGRVPAPIRLGGGDRPYWRVEELRRWVEAGCPDRRTWEAMRPQRGGRS
jgi:predicted DNA-binding transcriptional regulator AlpA